MEDKEQYSSTHIICPYCGYEKEPECEETGEWENDETCEDCGKIFFAVTSLSWSCSTAQDCKLNNEEHDFQYKQIKNSLYKECTKCGKIQV
ncbi:MAG: hypothetical protein ACFFG0_03690 [Candidatus Thorarchaeota archaeon]